ncbi:MAG: hypothetical protein ABW098_17465, partial [Candidatus Thiodiazotropha sp.]
MVSLGEEATKPVPFNLIPQGGATLKEKNILPWEQILSSTGKPHFRRAPLARKKARLKNKVYSQLHTLPDDVTLLLSVYCITEYLKLNQSEKNSSTC